MTTEANPNGAAPAAPSAPVQPAAAPAVLPAPAAPQVDHAKEPEQDPAWLGKRLERERKKAAEATEKETRAKLLAELGIDDPETAKKLVAEEKKRAEERKSLEQRVAERDADKARIESELKAYREATATLANEQLATLSDEQKNAVLSLAGDDPAKQLKAIATLRPTWAKPAPAVQQSQEQQSQTQTNGAQGASVPPGQTPPSAPAAPAKPAAPTAPGATAPPPAGAVVVQNHLETYNTLNDPKSPHYAPHYAALFYSRYQTEIVAAQKSRGAN